jgi:hypothetical protein
LPAFEGREPLLAVLSAIFKMRKGEPDLGAMAAHYDTAMLPLRLCELRVRRKGKTMAIAKEKPGD